MQELIWQFFSYFGDVTYWLGFMVSFFIVLPFLDKRDRKKVGWVYKLLLPAVLLSYGASFVLKDFFQIPRLCSGLSSCPETYGFPSGHATIAFSFALVISLYFKKPQIIAPSYGLAFLVALSRIMLGVHTLFDVEGGFIVGSLIAFLTYVFYKKFFVDRRLDGFILRKVIHLSSSSLIFLYFFLSKEILITGLAVISAVYFLSEILRMRKIYFPLIQDLTLYCRKKEEKGFVYSPLLFSLAIIFLLLLPKNYFLAGSITLLIGDAFAGLFGRLFGKIKIPYKKEKTLEGSLAFFISSFLFLRLFFDIRTALLTALFGTLVESLFVKFENFLLPITVTMFLFLLNFV